MRKACLLSLLCCSLHGYGQLASLQGVVADSSEDQQLENAVVMLLDAADSLLVTFTRTTKDGSFLLRDIPPRKYQLVITYPAYADYIDFPDLSKGNTMQMGIVPLTRKSELLEAVIVRQQLAAIRIKGDTIEYKADSFLVREGASVEELLRKLPGIQVDRNGEIMAHGEKVNKVLVDGEEFFSDDPGVVIKNLNADLVKEVQVFDKKSDQAEFTGIDDGETSKTINLTIKPEKKKGYFGKATASAGTRESYYNNLMLNLFKGSKKASAYGILSNTESAALTGQDGDRFGGSVSPVYDEDNGYFYYSDPDPEFSRDLRNNDGLPAAWSGGLHYSDKWNNDRKHINANYRFLKKNLRSFGSTISQYILPDTQYFNRQLREGFSSVVRNQVRGIYDLTLDSSSSVKVTVAGGLSQGENASRLESEALTADSGLVNTNRRQTIADNRQEYFSANVLWRKKFSKTGRTFSLNVSTDLNNQTTDGFLLSGTDFYDQFGEIYRSENFDQQKKNLSNTTTFSSSAVYTEPLSKKTFLSFNYRFSLNGNEAKRNSFNKDGGGDYTAKDSLFSNDFRFRYHAHTGGADFRYNGKKLMLIVGSAASFAAFRQTDLVKDTSTPYSFVNFFPKATIRYKFTSQKQLNFRYNGATNAPKLEQIQPIRENTDPLNVQVGNPALRQQFTHNASVSFQDYKVLNQRSIYSSVYTNVTDNAISTSSEVDEGGKNTTRFVNVDGNYSVGIYAGYNRQLKKLNVNVGLSPNVSISRISNYINGLHNINNNRNYSIQAHISKYEDKKYSIWIYPSLTYTYSKSSLRPDVVTKFLTSGTDIGVNIHLPAKFEFHTNGALNLRQKTDVFDRDLNTFKVDAALSRKFFEKNNGEIKLSVYDLLDQNIGFNRTATSNFIVENNYTTLRRYFMLSFIFNISKTP